MICSACGNQTSPIARYCSNCGRPVIKASTGTPAETASTSVFSRLVRPRAARLLGGVCAGFAQAYGWDVVLVRILLCIMVLFGCGTPVLAYFVAWIIMPNEPYFIGVANDVPTSM